MSQVVFSTYPSLVLVAMLLAVSAAAFVGVSNSLVVDRPSVPILPYRVIISRFLFEISQNLF